MLALEAGRMLGVVGLEDALAVELSSHVTKGESLRGDQAHTFFQLKYRSG